MSNDICSIFFSDIYDYFENYTSLNTINITYTKIINCTDIHYKDNIIMSLMRNVSHTNYSKIENQLIPLFNKIISIIKSNTTNNQQNAVFDKLFNKTDSNDNNWLQILLQSLDKKYDTNSNTNYIKDIIYILFNTFSNYISYTNINNTNNYNYNALLMASNNIYLNDITLKYFANNTNINYINDSGDSVILICAYDHINLNLLDTILNTFSNVNVNIINKYENNVLLNLIMYDKEKIEHKELIISIVNKLIEKGIDLKYKTSKETDALKLCTVYDKLDIFKLIFDKLLSTDNSNGSNKKYIIDSIQTLINEGTSSNIVQYYNTHISLQNKYSLNSNAIPLLKPSTNKIPSFDISIKYGVELETCIKLDKKCIKRDIDTESIIYTHRDNNNSENIINTSVPSEWLDLTTIFLNNYIKERVKTNNQYKRLVNKLKDIYKFIVVTNTPKNKKYKYIYDLNKLELIQKDGFIDYTNPIITTDISVKCGDYKYLYSKRKMPTLNEIKKEYNITDNNIEHTFHIEFVTPILTCDPIMGRNSISYDLSVLNELFLLIGMDKQGCYTTNKSQGYHVNLSLVNNKTGKPLPLLREFFKSQFFKDYLEWEKNAYPKYRTSVSEYARPLYSLIKSNNFNTGYSQIATDKYVSLHRKELKELVEVRLFSATNNYKELISRTKEVIALLYSSYNKWYSSIQHSIYSSILKKNTTKKKLNNYTNMNSKPNNIINIKRNKTKNKRRVYR